MNLQTFKSFPTLPRELRLQIYLHSFPHRILQLGYDFPLPFLDLPVADPVLLPSSRHRCLNPIRTALPALFHVCGESRDLCMSTYIPFAYTYAHPKNDTFYISSQIAPILHENLNWYYKCARPPLYPIVQLERVAIEFDWFDLPPQVWRNSGWIETDNSRFLHSSSLLENYLETFAEFGPPKEILLVAGIAGRGMQTSLPRWSQLPGFKEIEFTLDPYVHEQGKAEKLLQYIHDCWYYRREDVEWFRANPPIVKIVGVRKEELIWKTTKVSSKLLAMGDSIARAWTRAEFDVNGRYWQMETDGSPYNEKNVKKALARAKMGEHPAPSYLKT